MQTIVIVIKYVPHNHDPIFIMVGTYFNIESYFLINLILTTCSLYSICIPKFDKIIEIHYEWFKLNFRQKY